MLRKDKLDDVFKRVRIGDVRQIEVVHIGHFDSMLQLVDNGFWATDDVGHHTV